MGLNQDPSSSCLDVTFFVLSSRCPATKVATFAIIFSPNCRASNSLARAWKWRGKKRSCDRPTLAQKKNLYEIDVCHLQQEASGKRMRHNNILPFDAPNCSNFTITIFDPASAEAVPPAVFCSSFKAFFTMMRVLATPWVLWFAIRFFGSNTNVWIKVKTWARPRLSVRTSV